MANFGVQSVMFCGPNTSNAQPVMVCGPNTSNVQPVLESGPNAYDATPVMRCGPNTYGATPVLLAGCFPKFELVQTDADGGVPIGSLKVGDKISTWDMDQKKRGTTAVTEIHKYTITEIICFNNAMWVSVTHPLLVMEVKENGFFVPRWKVAFDVNIGDLVVGYDGRYSIVKSKNKCWYDAGIEVLNLSTDSGVPFLVGNFVVRSDNARDNIEWANAALTQRLLAA
ncbi:MAG: hypothetical protein LBD96_00890 [Treponema sp.]|jgi:hypothetical protein|nr:hypothetical protein [Treponema sp.]